jgi:hypothetical protein
MNSSIHKLLYISYSEALNLKEEFKIVEKRTSTDSTGSQKSIKINPKKRPSILFSIIQGPKLYA